MAGPSPAMTPIDLGLQKWALLRQPPLAPPVVLALAEGLAAAFGDPEVELLDVLVLGERLGLAVEHHAALLEHIAMARAFERHDSVLLSDQERHALLGAERHAC